MKPALAPMVIAALGLMGCAGRARAVPFDVLVRGPAAQCSLEVAGRAVTFQELVAVARREVQPGRGARILLPTSEVPYRCIGGAIYSLQTAGFEQVTALAPHFRPLK
ncbi:biopolymer transporter ExbD [Sphingomonas sp. PL-96]|uniref:biopolymer transporter ExbD n=1 Tax=Sphingomonas sp. PL-96 TaxID=2887201 RepID=UPI001E390E52|nr:biopolymer transporter ExbD [Sphingomonas sp. PL-96]MCC2975422.1 biopolymer transporter ExbD [Sphingomonas sp. PL-96]